MAAPVIYQLKHILVEQLDINLRLEDVDETVSIFEEGLGLDSMAIVELITSIEEHFGFEFSDTELSIELFRNLTVLADFIGTKVGSRGGVTTGK